MIGRGVQPVVLLEPLQLSQWPPVFSPGRALLLTQCPANPLGWPSVGEVAVGHSVGIYRC